MPLAVPEPRQAAGAALADGRTMAARGAGGSPARAFPEWLWPLGYGNGAAMQALTGMHALPKACRILRRPDFTLCYDQGRRYFSRYFVLFVRTRHEGTWRVGFAVTKKMGNAVRRNRIKRILREFFRLHSQVLPRGVDMVAVPRRELVGVPVDLALVRAELGPLVSRLAGKSQGEGAGA